MRLFFRLVTLNRLLIWIDNQQTGGAVDDCEVVLVKLGDKGADSENGGDSKRRRNDRGMAAKTARFRHDRDCFGWIELCGVARIEKVCRENFAGF